MLWWNSGHHHFPIRVVYYWLVAGVFSISLLLSSNLHLRTVSSDSSNVFKFNSTVDYIDAVISYCNGSEAKFLEGLAAVRFKGVKLKDSATPNRFEDHDDLKILLRSLELNGQLFRRVYLVLAGPEQVPYWLNTDNPRLQVVYHRDIWTDPRQLPVFNSLAIETNLHHISGLSNVFVYFNDDFALTNPVSLEDFVIVDSSRQLKAVKIRMDIVLPFDYNPSPTSLDASWVRPAVVTRKLVDQICPQWKKWLLAHEHIQHHSPTVFTRSALYDAEFHHVFEPFFRRTSGTQLRNGTELNVFVLFNSYSQCQLGYKTLWGRKSEILYIGVNRAMVDPNYLPNMNGVVSHFGTRIKSGEVKFLCINDVTDSQNYTETGSNASVIAYNWRFSLFPNRSSFELL